MSITLYNETSLGGGGQTYTEDVPDMKDFSNRARSLKVEGYPWVAFTKKAFQGEFKIYRVGQYMNLNDFAVKISSLRVIKESLENPQITLYKNVNYTGARKDIFEEIDNVDQIKKEIGGEISSHKIKEGVWILCKDEHFCGERMFTKENVPNYVQIGWKNQLSSLKPLTPSDFE
ncbi:epidermal differentiation-specific protein-like [Callorhinchus milii]|uniref:Epidermal differentiation-specific-like protein n=1 Tax=Callorhinchus milii TaxID=7868 RepID=K4GFK9_CALMI|nr:epidermal differentiation-specific protein-like [Callorhinchus milii]AFM88613.1 Epidermal differentiation-specific -like protein [Callorhinchus milii]|eukprot:gi/632988955/ref/XP_007883388.1/ PREDICTED: epidermal differentiation-specific protein-like [Callorhinchus milii]